ncbi:hypothetical protein GCM10027275_54320 [Rhabdobacter roseus]|uniref:Uncharacterized protein n=1 Tax=Rhabdobacter roseus TaxID=1655419 RepID=A0A840TST4_9BACT|nr:hypothetical protein [Rhabdobacter roseus]MBB5287446.1 hypothetical protein [Rhabdobacter roseus]
MKTNHLLLLPILWLLGTLPAAAQEARLTEARLTNVPTQTTSRTPVAEGPAVFGVFDGRFPCAEIHKDWKQPARPDCVKMKWRLTLYHDPATQQPTIYRLNRSVREGTWALVRGIPTDPEAVVIQLDSDRPDVSVYLLKGDDNVLFVLDQQRNFRVGDYYLSYTLNRVTN